MTLHDEVIVIGVMDACLSCFSCLCSEDVEQTNAAMTRSKLGDSPLKLAGLTQIHKMQIF